MGRLSLSLLLFSAIAGGLSPASGDDADLEFFERKIRPALIRYCDECNAADSKKLGGGLRLDHRDGARRGGETGPALVPGKPDESLLIRAIRYDDVGLQMPPAGKLPADVIADLEEWVRRGAVDPRERPATSRTEESWAETMKQRSDWWSLKPVVSPPVPTPKMADERDDPVDRFLLARLETEGLTAASEADPRTLARRLSLVLLGLPPRADQTDELLRAAGESPAAYRAAVVGTTRSTRRSATTRWRTGCSRSCRTCSISPGRPRRLTSCTASTRRSRHSGCTAFSVCGRGG